MNHEISNPDLPDQLLLNHVHDIEKARELISKTLMCPSCNKRLMVNAEVEGVEYCQCSVSAGKKQYGVQTEDIPWQPFLEKPGIIVWRQEHPEVKLTLNLLKSLIMLSVFYNFY